MDTRFEGGIVALGEVTAVQGGGEGELGALFIPGKKGIAEILNELGGGAVLGLDVGALEAAGQEGRLPVVGACDGHAVGDQHDEPRQILVLGAEAVGDP
jgi:hypothetical protein